MTVQKERDGKRRKGGDGWHLKPGWKKFWRRLSSLMVGRSGTVGTAQRRTCGQGRNVEGARQTFQLKNQSSIMQEDYKESVSLALRTWRSRKSLKKQEANWKHQFFQLCLARLARKASMGRPVARLMISSLNVHVSWKPVNPQDCVWNKLYRNIMRIISQEKGTNHYSIAIWSTNLFLYLKQ